MKVKLLHLYSAFTIIQYSRALYNSITPSAQVPELTKFRTTKCLPLAYRQNALAKTSLLKGLKLGFRAKGARLYISPENRAASLVKNKRFGKFQSKLFLTHHLLPGRGWKTYGRNLYPFSLRVSNFQDVTASKLINAATLKLI